MLVNDDIHTKVTPEKVADIIESYRKRFGANTLQGEH
jgi:NADH:ubiquinone oxidoreductase subunit E